MIAEILKIEGCLQVLIDLLRLEGDDGISAVVDGSVDRDVIGVVVLADDTIGIAEGEG